MIESIRQVLSGMGKGDWLSVVGSAPSWLALALSLFSIVYARAAYKLNKDKETRAVHSINLYLADAYTKSSESGLVFYIRVTLTNRSDSPNAICEAELVLRFVQPNGFELVRRLRPLQTGSSDDNALQVGLRLNPWEAKSCECQFLLPTDPESRLARLPGARLEVTDSAGANYSVTADILSERLA